MKKNFIFFGLLLIQLLNAQAQETNLQQWDSYLKAIKYDQYISFHFSVGGENNRSLLYFEDQNNTKYLVVREKSILKRVVKFDGRDLFQLIEENFSAIRRLKNKLNTSNEKKIKQERADYQNPGIDYKTIGIKFKNLHFNHFRLRSYNQSEKISRAYQTLFDLAKEMETIATR